MAAEEPKETFLEGECMELPVLPFVDKYRLGEYYYTRTCYVEYYKPVIDMLNNQERCVTVTGTPGVGKSIFYAYFFKRFRKEMQGKNTCVVAAAYIRDELVNAIAFEDDDDIGVWHINEEGIDDFIAGALGLGKKVVLLCDGPPKRIRGWIQTVVFTRPYKEWMRVVRNDNCTLWVPLWTQEELEEAADYLVLDLLDEYDKTPTETIEERFRIFGGVARECFLPTKELVEEKKEDLLAEVAQVSTPEEFKRLARQGWTRDGFYHIFHFVPAKDGMSTTTELASPFVVQNLGKNLMETTKMSKEPLWKTVIDAPGGEALAECIIKEGALELRLHD